jgi:hypothetical protein
VLAPIQPAGYLIGVEAGELDLDRYEDLPRHARTAARQARWLDAFGRDDGSDAGWGWAAGEAGR